MVEGKIMRFGAVLALPILSWVLGVPLRSSHFEKPPKHRLASTCRHKHLFSLQSRFAFESSMEVKMYIDDRTMAVFSLLADYVRSPSLTHLRAERSLAKIAREIATRLDQKSAV